MLQFLFVMFQYSAVDHLFHPSINAVAEFSHVESLEIPEELHCEYCQHIKGSKLHHTDISCSASKNVTEALCQSAFKPWTCSHTDVVEYSCCRDYSQSPFLI